MPPETTRNDPANPSGDDTEKVNLKASTVARKDNGKAHELIISRVIHMANTWSTASLLEFFYSYGVGEASMVYHPC